MTLSPRRLDLIATLTGAAWPWMAPAAGIGEMLATVILVICGARLLLLAALGR
jgi:hypothetical protein